MIRTVLATAITMLLGIWLAYCISSGCTGTTQIAAVIGMVEVAMVVAMADTWRTDAGYFGGRPPAF